METKILFSSYSQKSELGVELRVQNQFERRVGEERLCCH